MKQVQNLGYSVTLKIEKKKKKQRSKQRWINSKKKCKNINDNINNKRCKKELTYILNKIGKTELSSKRISQRYKITVLDNSQDKSCDEPLQATKIIFEKTLKPSSMATHPGVYCLKTNDMSLSQDKIWHAYKRLTEIESVFKSMKSELGLRPIYHWKEKSIDAHLFITLLAYQCVQTIRSKLKANNIYSSWETIRRELSAHQMTTIEFKRKDGTTLKTRKASKPDLWQKELYDALAIKLMSGGMTKIIIEDQLFILQKVAPSGFCGLSNYLNLLWFFSKMLNLG